MSPVVQARARVVESPRRRVRAFALVMLTCWSVVGCSVVSAPGFEYVSGDSSRVQLGAVTPSDPKSPPAGVITPITPDLIRAFTESRPKSISMEIRSLISRSEPYRIGAGDVVQIIVYDHPELLPNPGAVISQQTDPTAINPAAGFTVGADGLIVFPFLGRLKIDGLTEVELAELVQVRLARYIKSPQVTARIASFRSKRAYVEGEVRNPGMLVITDVPMTLAEALNRAGGINPSGDRSNVVLVRGDRSYRIDLIDLVENGVSPNAISLHSGDVINVKSRDESKIFVMGEVSRPSALTMRNGRLTLNEALGEAGGPNLVTANASQIYVIRSTDKVGVPAIYHLNAGNPTALVLAESFGLQSRDVVYIDPVPLVNWNRLISLVLPSAQTIATSKSVLN